MIVAKGNEWAFLSEGGQAPDFKALKDAVETLCKMTKQKTSGQRDRKEDIPWHGENNSMIDMAKMIIVCEACALVLSGELDKLEQEYEKDWDK